MNRRRPALRPRPRSARTGGFTLLEVLAAAMIFAMVVTVLIGTSQSAVRQAGLSASRLEASLIAEQEIALLESFFNTQRTPPEDKEETRDRYAIRVYSEPAIDDFGSDPIGASRGGEPAGPSAIASGVGSVLAIEAPGVDQFLRRYEVRVEWIEGALPETIRRTTYGFDWEGARAALPELFQAAEGEEAGLAPEGEPGALPQLPTNPRARP